MQEHQWKSENFIRTGKNGDQWEISFFKHIPEIDSFPKQYCRKYYKIGRSETFKDGPDIYRFPSNKLYYHPQ